MSSRSYTDVFMRFLTLAPKSERLGATILRDNTAPKPSTTPFQYPRPGNTIACFANHIG